MTPDIFSINVNLYLEHECSLKKVLAHVIITHKSCSVECLNCHKKIFYRKVIVEHNDVH